MPAEKVTRSKKIRRRFRAAMEAKGLNQEKIAKRLNVSQVTISNWFNRTDSMTVGNFRCLCKLLDIPPEEILAIE